MGMNSRGAPCARGDVERSLRAKSFMSSGHGVLGSSRDLHVLGTSTPRLEPTLSCPRDMASSARADTFMSSGHRPLGSSRHLHVSGTSTPRLEPTPSCLWDMASSARAQRFMNALHRALASSQALDVCGTSLCQLVRSALRHSSRDCRGVSTEAMVSLKSGVCCAPCRSHPHHRRRYLPQQRV